VAVTSAFLPWALGVALIGLGTALVYPTLIAAVGDVAHPTWRATAVGVYRLWRDTGYVVGALLGGVVADLFDLRAAVLVLAALSLLSGLVVAARMRETSGGLPSGPEIVAVPMAALLDAGASGPGGR
jgi:MFS family permease